MKQVKIQKCHIPNALKPTTKVPQSMGFYYGTNFGALGGGGVGQNQSGCITLAVTGSPHATDAPRMHPTHHIPPQYPGNRL